MASDGHAYTLVGFSEELDRRPLVFVEALPAGKVCSACGLVPKVKASLPCDHTFCKPCYEQCERSGQIICPLDGESSSADEVFWINHSPRSILAKQVRCWNRRHGCSVVTAAADISTHFHHECGHHSARCPKCAAEILTSDMCAHLESRCGAAREAGAAAALSGTVPPEQECLGATCSEIADGFRQTHNDISISMSSTRAELREISRTLKIGVRATTSRQEDANERNFGTRTLQESLNQMIFQTAKLNDRLEEFTQNAHVNQQTFHNTLVEKIEVLKQSLSDTVPPRMDHWELAAQLVAYRETMGDWQRETKAEFDRLSLTIDRQYERMGELFRSTDASQETRTRNSAGAPEAHTESLVHDASKIAWAKNSTPEDIQNALALCLPSFLPVATMHTWTIQCRSLKEAAGLGDFRYETGEPVYLRGYCVSGGVAFHSVRDVCLAFELRKGQMDRYLEWPFNLQLRLSILHPDEPDKLEYCVTPCRSSYLKDSFSQPIVVSDDYAAVYSICLSLERLESWGFIKDDRMLVRLSLEDPPAGEER